MSTPPKIAPTSSPRYPTSKPPTAAGGGTAFNPPPVKVPVTQQQPGFVKRPPPGLVKHMKSLPSSRGASPNSTNNSNSTATTTTTTNQNQTQNQNQNQNLSNQQQQPPPQKDDPWKAGWDYDKEKEKEKEKSTDEVAKTHHQPQANGPSSSSLQPTPNISPIASRQKPPGAIDVPAQQQQKQVVATVAATASRSSSVNSDGTKKDRKMAPPLPPSHNNSRNATPTEKTSTSKRPPPPPPAAGSSSSRPPTPNSRNATPRSTSTPPPPLPPADSYEKMNNNNNNSNTGSTVPNVTMPPPPPPKSREGSRNTTPKNNTDDELKKDSSYHMPENYRGQRPPPAPAAAPAPSNASTKPDDKTNNQADSSYHMPDNYRGQRPPPPPAASSSTSTIQSETQNQQPPRRQPSPHQGQEIGSSLPTTNSTKPDEHKHNNNIDSSSANNDASRPQDIPQQQSSKNALPPRKSSTSRQNSRSNSPGPAPPATVTNYASCSSLQQQPTSNKTQPTSNKPNQPNHQPVVTLPSSQNNNNNNNNHNFADPYQSSDMQLFDKPTSPSRTGSASATAGHGCANPPGKRILTKTKECQTEEDVIGNLEKEVRELKKELAEMKRRERNAKLAAFEESQLQQQKQQQSNQTPSVYVVSSQEVAHELTRLLAKDPKSIERRRNTNNNNNSTTNQGNLSDDVSASGSFVQLPSMTSPLSSKTPASTRRLQALAGGGYEEEAIETRDKIYIRSSNGVIDEDYNNSSIDQIEATNRSIHSHQTTYNMLPVAVAAAKERTVVRPVQSKRFATSPSSSSRGGVIYSDRKMYVAEKESLLLSDEARTNFMASRVHQFPTSNQHHHQHDSMTSNSNNNNVVSLSSILAGGGGKQNYAGPQGDISSIHHNHNQISQTSRLIERNNSNYHGQNENSETMMLRNSEIRARNLKLHEEETARQMEKIRGRGVGEEDYRYHSYVPTNLERMKNNNNNNFNSAANDDDVDDSPFFVHGNPVQSAKRQAKDPMHSVIALEEL